MEKLIVHSDAPLEDEHIEILRGASITEFLIGFIAACFMFPRLINPPYNTSEFSLYSQYFFLICELALAGLGLYGLITIPSIKRHSQAIYLDVYENHIEGCGDNKQTVTAKDIASSNSLLRFSETYDRIDVSMVNKSVVIALPSGLTVFCSVRNPEETVVAIKKRIQSIK